MLHIGFLFFKFFFITIQIIIDNKKMVWLEKGINKYVVLLVLIISCSQPEEIREKTVDRAPTIEITTDLIIGSEDQPLENQLGRPIAVRTDEEGNIYIADRASRQIKVFDEKGNHLKNLGGRGRGPGEFQEIEQPVEWTPEGHLVVMDRGKLQYTVISTDGEQIEEYPYNLSEQFYPQVIRYIDGQLLTIFADGDAPSDELSYIDRDLIYIYSRDFQERIASLFPFNRLNFKSNNVYPHFVANMGSMALTPSKDKMIYSPGIYNGKFYLFHKQSDNLWKYEKSFSGIDPHYKNSYIAYTSEQQMLDAEEKKIPGAATVYYDGAQMGRVYSIDAGIYYLNSGEIVQFFAEWREGDMIGTKSQYLLDISVQIFDENMNSLHHSYLFSIERKSPFLPRLVNWKDKHDRFYFLNPGNDDLFATVPTVSRFSLDL